MTAGEFRELLNHRTDVLLLDVCLHDEGLPYVFEPEPSTWDTFRDTLVGQLGVTRAEVKIIGSGRFGFSLAPRSNLRRFNDNSDIDVVIVNAALFDELWFALLRAAYPRWPITSTLDDWLAERRAEIYTGYLTPVAVKLDVRVIGAKGVPVVNFATRWFNALKQAARHPPRRHSDVEGRLYRTWQHADLYHLHSLAALRKTLAE